MTLRTSLLTILLAGLVSLGASSVDAGAERELFGTPHGVAKGAARVVSFDTKFHGEPRGEPLAHVNGAFRLEGFPFPSRGRYASVFFLRKGHFAVHRPVRALSDGEDPELGLIVPQRLPARLGGVVGVSAQVTRGEEGGEVDRGVVRYVPNVIELCRERDARVVRIPTGAGGRFRAALAPGRYTVSSADAVQSVQIEVRAGVCEVLVLEVLPDPPLAR